MDQRASWVSAGCGNEPGDVRAAESGPRDMATDSVMARARLPYPVCLAIQGGNESSLREAVRRLVEGAV